MENTEENLNKLKLQTQEYSVYLTDEKQTSSGSGVLYYPGTGENLFIFTCAHVIEELAEPFKIYYFVPIDRDKEDYQIIEMNVNHEQIVYSPLDDVTQNEDNTTKHSIDVAVICLKKNKEILLNETDYYVGEAHKEDSIFIQGFPGEGISHEELVEGLDCSDGKVLHNISNKDTIVCRIEDLFIDSGNRVYELQGFSGSPVWNAKIDKKSLMGLISCGIGQTVYRGKINAVKMEIIRSIMKNHFQILMKTDILRIPEEDIAPEKGNASYTVNDKPMVKNIYDKWVVAQTEKVKAYIDDVKFQKAIDTAKEVIKESNFFSCSKEVILSHMKHLLYCYEVCFLDEEYKKLELKMREKNLLEEHDALRWISLNFGERNFKEVMHYAEKILKEKKEDKKIYRVIEVYMELCKAYEEDASVEETIGKFLDENEALKIKCDDAAEESLIYQIIGYVYGEHYHKYKKSVRCLNLAYRKKMDHAALETLGCAYYFLAIENAIKKDGTVDIMKIDKVSLYNARECFLILLDKADNLYLSAMMKREGGVIFNTFVFQQDNYRVLTLYPHLMENLLTDNRREKRDFENKYARFVCQSGEIELSEFHYLEEKERILYDTLAHGYKMLKKFDFVHTNGLYNISQMENELKDAIIYMEKNLNKIEEREKISVITILLNLYSCGRRFFGWNVVSQVEEYMKIIRANENQEMVMSLEDFVYENTHNIEEAEKKFIESWETKPSFITWIELLQFYKRNNMLNKADQMFECLFRDHMEYVEAEPEYAYRAYITYILDYKRDIKNALQFYLTHKKDMKDENIKEYWEHELMFHTNCFNNPEQFEEERKQLVEQNLLSEEEFHRTALVVYMCNLDSKKAWKHFSKENPAFGIFEKDTDNVPYLTKEGAEFLVWQRRYPPHMEQNIRGMNLEKAASVLEQFKLENWHIEESNIGKRLEIEIRRTIVIDAWGLYLLAVLQQLHFLEYYDCIYITHASIARMLEEMTYYKNDYVQTIISYLEVNQKVKLQSPGFEAQLKVREIGNYYEPCSAIAMAVEVGVPAVIGDPLLDENMISEFKKYIVRPDSLKEL